MSNTSATGGYLIPADAPAVNEDTELEDIFQAAISGMTGIAGQLVRPRWQPGNPKQPAANANWAAFSVTMQMPDNNPSIQHVGAEDGKDVYKRHIDVQLLVTLYGPDSGANASRLRDGLQIAQNSETLNASGVAFVEAGEIREMPELVNNQWIRRKDLVMRFRREIVRDYPILNIVEADPVIISDQIGIITN